MWRTVRYWKRLIPIFLRYRGTAKKARREQLASAQCVCGADRRVPVQARRLAAKGDEDAAAVLWEDQHAWGAEASTNPGLAPLLRSPGDR